MRCHRGQLRGDEIPMRVAIPTAAKKMRCHRGQLRGDEIPMRVAIPTAAEKMRRHRCQLQHDEIPMRVAVAPTAGEAGGRTGEPGGTDHQRQRDEDCFLHDPFKGRTARRARHLPPADSRNSTVQRSDPKFGPSSKRARSCHADPSPRHCSARSRRVSIRCRRRVHW